MSVNFQLVTRRPHLLDKMEAHSTASLSTRVSLTQVVVQAEPRDKQEQVGWPQNYFVQCCVWFYSYFMTDRQAYLTK